jgi:hypothetical protein
MGYYVINNLRKDKYMTTSDKTKKLISEIKSVDSLKAVRVAMELNELQDKTTGQLIDLVKQMDVNMKLLATKVLELEKRYERSSN